MLRKVLSEIRERKLLRTKFNAPLLRDAFFHYVLFKLYRALEPGENILKKDWKYLIILDACRADYFLKAINEVGIKGKFKTIISVGCTTPSFIEHTFKDGKLFRDIVYINGNPNVNIAFHALNPRGFYKFVNIWLDHWDEKAGTIYPSTIIKISKKFIKKYPNKRFIIHFMQPHYPYLTTDTTKLREQSRKLAYKHVYKLKAGLFNVVADPSYILKPISYHRKHYYKTLKKVLYDIKPFLNYLSSKGKTVLTSDHAESFGERFFLFRIYGHVSGPFPWLRRVPWLEL